MAPVVRLLSATPAIESRVAVTAQHRRMLDQVLDLFDILPDDDLNLMAPGQGLSEITGGILAGLGHVLEDFAPDLVLLHGDTTTTLAASLAAYYRRIAVGHVEAGLRTGNIHAPWPEEVNRRVAGVIARLHFAPTEQARQSLLAENIPEAHIFVTGNTVIDALRHMVRRLDADSSLGADLDARFGIDAAQRLILVTGHRRESFGDGIARICDALARLAQRDDIRIIYPVHLNPHVLGPVKRRLGGLERVSLVPPQDYLTFVHLMRRAALILTDSGGVQEEAPTLGTPVLVMRATTERPEAVASGAVRLVGADAEAIFREASRLLDDPAAHSAMARASSPYGDGQAAQRIRDAILAWAQSRQSGSAR